VGEAKRNPPNGARLRIGGFRFAAPTLRAAFTDDVSGGIFSRSQVALGNAIGLKAALFRYGAIPEERSALPEGGKHSFGDKYVE